MAHWDSSGAEPTDLDETPAPAAPLQIPTQWRASTGPSLVERHEPDFVPPEPAPLPTDEMFWVTLIALIGGPVWLLYLFFFDRYAAALWWVLALLVSVAGVVLLVMRQPANREDEDPYDDGARL